MHLEHTGDRAQDMVDFFFRARRSLRRAAFAQAASNGETAERDAEPAEQEKFKPRCLRRKAGSQCGQRKRGAELEAKQQKRIHDMTVPRQRAIAESIVALEDREVKRVAERASPIASRIATDLRSAPRTPFMAPATARMAKRHTRTESVQVIQTIPL